MARHIVPAPEGKKFQKSYSQYAEDYGVDKRTIQRWANKDYPLDDPDALRLKLGIQKNAPASTTPLTLAQKKEKLLDEQIAKIQIANAIAKGEYTENSKVREDMASIATTQRAALMRLENDLPGVLAGLDSAPIQKILREKIDEIMRDLHDAFSSLYRAPAAIKPCPPSP